MKDRSEADCTLEMPSNLWAPASGGSMGGLLGPTMKVFHIVIPAIYVSLSLSATFCWHTCDKFDLATPPMSMNTFEPKESHFWRQANVGFGALLLVISIWFFHCSLKPRTAFMRFISRLDRARAKRASEGRLCGTGEESSRRLWALMGSRPYIGRGYGWTRARIHGSQIYFFFVPLSWLILPLAERQQPIFPTRQRTTVRNSGLA